MFVPISIRVTLALLGLVFWGCARPIAESLDATKPGHALQALIDAASAQDEQRFKAGLSRDFIATVERYQEFGERKTELRGAFDWPIFMRSLAQSSPQPKEELVRGNKAIVKAFHQDGREVQTEMILEEGRWRLAVPAGMVRDLDHFEKLEEQLLGAKETTATAPASSDGEEGSANRVRNLPADATKEAQAKAAALDAFDAGDLENAEGLLLSSLVTAPTDEELVVALGRLRVQQGRAAEARALLAKHMEENPKSVRARHYLGMAYMLENKPSQAVEVWREVMQSAPEYAKRYQLDRRIEAALTLAAGVEGKHVIPSPPASPASP